MRGMLDALAPKPLLYPTSGTSLPLTPTPRHANPITDRRDFIKTGTAAGIALAAMPSLLRADAKSPSNSVRVAVVGTNNRGLDHINFCTRSGIDNVEIAYVSATWTTGPSRRA